MQHDFKAESLELHKKLHGKIELKAKAPLRDEHDLSVYYTPGVGAVSSYLAKHPEEASEYSIKHNTVAVVSDGSAVLGLGNIGPFGALPVMEGKAMLFRELAGVDAFPICLDTQDPDEIVAAVKNIAPVFGGINLEDIAAPKCFEIEKRLQDILDIPVIHDDQHATAIAVLAGLINAFKLVGKNPADATTVIVGAGAAGNGVAKLLLEWGMGNVILLDSKGILGPKRTDLDPNKQELVSLSNKNGLDGNVQTALKGADVVLGLSGPDLLKGTDIKLMAKNPIVFAMANPAPEIMPEVALSAGAAVVATGRSDYPNQINNVLVFPGMFKGAISTKTKVVDNAIKLRAAGNLADLIKTPTADKIISSVFDPGVVEAVASAFGIE